LVKIDDRISLTWKISEYYVAISGTSIHMLMIFFNIYAMLRADDTISHVKYESTIITM